MEPMPALEMETDDENEGNEHEANHEMKQHTPPPPVLFHEVREQKGKRDLNENVPLRTDVRRHRFWKQKFVVFGCGERIVSTAKDLVVTHCDGDEMLFPEEAQSEGIDHEIVSMDTQSTVTITEKHSGPQCTVMDAVNAVSDIPIDEVAVSSDPVPESNVMATAAASNATPSVPDTKIAVKCTSRPVIPWTFDLCIESASNQIRAMVRCESRSSSLPIYHRCDRMTWHRYQRSDHFLTKCSRYIVENDGAIPGTHFLEDIDLRILSAAPGIDDDEFRAFKQSVDSEKPVFVSSDIIDGKYVMAIKVRATLLSIADSGFAITIKAMLIQMEMPEIPSFTMNSQMSGLLPSK